MHILLDAFHVVQPGQRQTTQTGPAAVEKRLWDHICWTQQVPALYTLQTSFPKTSLPRNPIVTSLERFRRDSLEHKGLEPGRDRGCSVELARIIQQSWGMWQKSSDNGGAGTTDFEVCCQVFSAWLRYQRQLVTSFSMEQEADNFPHGCQLKPHPLSTSLLMECKCPNTLTLAGARLNIAGSYMGLHPQLVEVSMMPVDENLYSDAPVSHMASLRQPQKQGESGQGREGCNHFSRTPASLSSKQQGLPWEKGTNNSVLVS